MLSLYRPGDGRLHRMPAGRKTLLLLTLVLAVSLLPSTWWAAAAAASVTVACYALADLRDGVLGLAELGRQVFALRWVLAFTAVSQLVFLGPEPATANTTRVAAAIVLAALLELTTRVSTLLETFERGLGPLGRVLDPQRAALLLTIALTTVPVILRLAREVREAQHARGARADLRTFTVPFLILTLKHADQVGEALAARGWR